MRVMSWRFVVCVTTPLLFLMRAIFPFPCDSNCRTCWNGIVGRFCWRTTGVTSGGKAALETKELFITNT